SGEPITFGVPLPLGAVHDQRAWRLTSPAGESSTVQARVLDRWRDGSVRWLLVDAQVALTSSTDAQYFLEPGEMPSLNRLISLKEQGGELTVDTGRAAFRIKPGSAI